MRHIDHARARFRAELAQHKRHHYEPSRCPFWARVNRTGVQVSGESVRDQSPTRALEAILARVIGARITA